MLHKIIPFFLTSFLIVVSLSAQKKPFEIEDLYKAKTVGSPHVSPSGNKIAFTVTDFNLFEGKSNTDIYIQDIVSNELLNISNSDRSDGSPFWGESDDKLYFTSGSQIYLYDFTLRSSRQLTDAAFDISNPVISPDGKKIAFTTSIYPECGVDADCHKRIKASAEEGAIQAYMADELLFRHWTSYNDERETHIFLYDIENNTFKDLTRSEWASDRFILGGSVKYAFSPNSDELCFISSDEKILASSTNSDLFTISFDDHSVKNITKENKSWDGYPVYSPDGLYIVYKLQTIPDFEADRYRIAVYNRGTESTTILTENFDNTIDDFKWGIDSKTIYFTAEETGYSPIYSLNVATKEAAPVSEKISVFGFGVAADHGKIFYVSSRVDKPREIFSINLNDRNSRQITFFNQDLVDQVDLRPAEEHWFEGADGKKIHTFLVKPHNFDPNKKYPLILNVHGGPQSQWMNSFRGDWQVYPGKGYIVAFPNPHGSTGYGSEFTEAISGDWGGKVFEDLMKVTDELEKLSYVDEKNIGAMGWSFGGYMMNWFQAKTERYKCLVSMMGIFDLESMWGATEELWFVNWDLKGQPWNSEIYEKYSPSNYVESFATPALIIAGKKDYRVPYSQSVQYFTTLQTLGIDSRLIIFPNDGHWPDHVKSMPLYYNAHLEWFHKYLGGEEAPYDSKKLIKNLGFNIQKNN
jgi:dipeptidyl aminopeptidase/acylaminoacyl peptidase